MVTTLAGGILLSKREALHKGLIWAMTLCLAAYSAGLVLQGGVSHPIVDRWLSLLTSWLPAAVCWLAVTRVGLRRPEILLAALALTSLAAGDTYYLPWTSDWSPAFPGPGDLGYLLFYVLILAMLTTLVRRDLRGQSSAVWLDCAVGSLGAAAVLAVVLQPVLDSALTGSWSLATAVAVGYPLSDLLLVAAIVGIAALGGAQIGNRWGLMIVGLVSYAVADVLYALQATAGTYLIGRPMDAGWAIGVALIALYVDGTARRDGAATPETRQTTSAAALAVSGAATAAGLGVLVMGTREDLSTLAVALAGTALLAAAARTQLSYRQLAWMADLRRLAATTDELTGLANRRVLYAEGRARLLETRGRRRALLMLDLDKFKTVNDSLGHHAGDLLLMQVATRLSEQVRQGDLLARLGGDEFAILLEDAGRDEAVEVAVKLRAALAEPFTLEEVVLYSSASVGISVLPEDGDDLSALLRKADIAMYRAKGSKSGYHVYSGVDDANDATRLRTVDELRTALASGQFLVHYQPKVDLNTGEVHTVEALVRWDHPTRGLLYPDAFLALVEEAGLMPTMTRGVLDLALDQAAVWLLQGRPLTVAVNLSASSLVDTDLPRQVGAMLEARDLPPETLQLEITEEFLMADRDQARAILTRLRELNVQISVDDFGTGYSSLSYLRDLPVDELKLDRSFIFPMADDARAAALVASTIDLAHSLGLRMVAEGVETEAAYTELARLGCDQAQGYYMSRPVPAAELDHWLSVRRASRELTDSSQQQPSAALR